MLLNPLATLEYLQIKVYQSKTNQAVFTQLLKNLFTMSGRRVFSFMMRDLL